MSHELWAAMSSHEFLVAAWTTVWLTFAAQAAGTLGGLFLVPFRVSRHRWMRTVASAYLLVFRGTPELLQLIAWYAILPLAGVNLNLVQIAVIGLAANEVARMVEIIRGALLAIDDGQHEAARVLGLSRPATLRHVIGPQSARAVLAALGNEVNIMFKTTALVSVIGMTELLRQSQLTAQTVSNPLAPYLAALIYYLALTTLWGAFQGGLLRKSQLGPKKTSYLTAWWISLSGRLQGEL